MLKGKRRYSSLSDPKFDFRQNHIRFNWEDLKDPHDSSLLWHLVSVGERGIQDDLMKKAVRILRTYGGVGLGENSAGGKVGGTNLYWLYLPVYSPIRENVIISGLGKIGTHV